ncbi:uncharacterized protein M421DRAFT_10501 [Didymella exigua CBS 183.55]|uniref:Tyr recombinase domain-containing protein n=1 Tax=Didymella exigua CBS 183.55 TaxID=1150837 RepID=A0A6A5R5N4_9PLEO|nr:uncharacterized protein M421DRAFT_10501 [Didymella exigua CBS 183.55]KAF1922500.1 hypothetical protein M421DRAFT_10501 [Didymella exigua CBS 183.55]
MDLFDDIAALAGDENPFVSIEEAAEAYDRDGITRILKLWKRFAVNLPSPYNESEVTAPFQSDLKVPWVKAFMAWRVKTGLGKISDRITVTTLLKEFQQLRRGIRLAKNFALHNKDIAVIKRFIRELANTRGASTAMRPKSVAFALDADEIQYYLWNCSERVYAHPRMMVQFSFWLHVVSVWGLRTGEVTESSSHRGSNEGIHYGDITLSLVAREGQLRYQIKITLRNRKFARGIQSKVKTVTLNEHMDPKERFKCPVRKFIALALADDVFVQQMSPKDFDNRWVPTSAGSRLFGIKEDKQSLPVFRKMLPGGAVSPDRIMTAMSTTTFLKEICEECGYTEPVTTYTFRRGVANKLEANASSKGTQEALGHKGERTWHAYAAPTISYRVDSRLFWSQASKSDYGTTPITIKGYSG